jgi:hypothetical protein
VPAHRASQLPLDDGTGCIDFRAAMTAAAPKVLRNHFELHWNGLRKALIPKPRCRDKNHAAALATFDLRVEPMPNQIGDRVDALHSHARRRTL